MRGQGTEWEDRGSKGEAGSGLRIVDFGLRIGGEGRWRRSADSRRPDTGGVAWILNFAVLRSTGGPSSWPQNWRVLRCGPRVAGGERRVAGARTAAKGRGFC